MSRWVNCIIEPVVDDINQWGEIYDNRTGVGILGNVAEDRADFGICLYDFVFFCYLQLLGSSWHSSRLMVNDNQAKFRRVRSASRSFCERYFML